MNFAGTPFARVALLSILSFLTTTGALDLSRDYEHGPVQFEENVDLFFTIDRAANTAALAVKLKDEDLVTSTSSQNWIGLGVSEATSGSMLGADVVTAEFAQGDVDKCKFTDRYVPFYAFPLIEARPNSPSAFPIPDNCQDDGSWELVRCERDVNSGEMIFEVSRSLDAHDTQDREIGPGFQNIIYAAGTQFMYHGPKRASTRLVLYQADGGTNLVAQGEPDLPDDIDEEVLLVATEYEVPSEFTTTYGCTSTRIDIKEGQKKMIVASEPVLNANVQLVHHLIVYLCRGEEYADLTEKTIECGTGLTGVTGPLGDPKSQCVTFVGGYAKGAGRNVLPLNAGVLVDEGEYILAMETHYDNPQQLDNVVDSSGMRVYLTNTLRPDEAGTIIVGDPLVSLTGDPVESREYEFSCPSECTKKLPNPVNIYFSLLHMHTTGMEIYDNKLTADGTFVEHFNKVSSTVETPRLVITRLRQGSDTVELTHKSCLNVIQPSRFELQINFWSDSFQTLSYFDPPKTLSPGDHLQVTCKYDTSKRPATKFGGATSDEMCMDFLGYWPVQRDPTTGQRLNICSFVKTGPTSLNNATLCGDIATFQTDTANSILPIPNPKLEDTFGAPTDFGNKIETCDIPSLSPSPDISETEEPITPEPGTPLEGDNPLAIEDNPLAVEDNVCFPGSATVTLSDGSMKPMSDVAIGDEVLVGPNEYSEVFVFTHKRKDVVYTFVDLGLETGISLSLTYGHFLYLNGNLRKAGDAIVGDIVRLGNGATARIVRKGSRTAHGLFNPQTIQGNIVVNGVIASTYTHSVEPSLAHSLLVPLRWMYRAWGVDSSPILGGA